MNSNDIKNLSASDLKVYEEAVIHASGEFLVNRFPDNFSQMSQPQIYQHVRDNISDDYENHTPQDVMSDISKMVDFAVAFHKQQSVDLDQKMTDVFVVIGRISDKENELRYVKASSEEEAQSQFENFLKDEFEWNGTDDIWIEFIAPLSNEHLMLKQESIPIEPDIQDEDTYRPAM